MQDNIIDYYDYLSQILPPLCRCCLTCFLLYDMNVGQKVYVNTKLKRNSNCYLTLYLFGLGRAVIGLVQLVFFELVYRNQNFRFVKFSTKTDQNGWNSISFGLVSISIDSWSVVGFLCLEFGPVGHLVLLVPKIFSLDFFKKKCSIRASCFMALFGPFMLFVIKPFLETCFRPFLETSFVPDSGLFYFGHLWDFFRNPFWPKFGPFLFCPFLGLF